MGVAYLFDGMVVKSGGSEQHREITVWKVPREKQLEILPRILEATSPQDFREAIAPLNSETLPNTERETQETEKPKR